jgi:hypothetical protein
VQAPKHEKAFRLRRSISTKLATPPDTSSEFRQRCQEFRRNPARQPSLRVMVAGDLAAIGLVEHGPSELGGGPGTVRSRHRRRRFRLPALGRQRTTAADFRERLRHWPTGKTDGCPYATALYQFSAVRFASVSTRSQEPFDCRFSLRCFIPPPRSLPSRNPLRHPLMEPPDAFQDRGPLMRLAKNG